MAGSYIGRVYITMAETSTMCEGWPVPRCTRNVRKGVENFAAYVRETRAYKHDVFYPQGDVYK